MNPQSNTENHPRNLRLRVNRDRTQRGDPLALRQRQHHRRRPAALASNLHEINIVLDKEALQEVVSGYKIIRIFHLDTSLSATSELSPGQAWQVNIQGLLNVLNVAKK